MKNITRQTIIIAIVANLFLSLGFNNIDLFSPSIKFIINVALLTLQITLLILLMKKNKKDNISNNRISKGLKFGGIALLLLLGFIALGYYK